MSRGTTGTCASVVNKSRKFLPVVDADLSKLQSSNTPKYGKSLRDRNIFLKPNLLNLNIIIMITVYYADGQN